MIALVDSDKLIKEETEYDEDEREDELFKALNKTLSKDPLEPLL